VRGRFTTARQRAPRGNAIGEGAMIFLLGFVIVAFVLIYLFYRLLPLTVLAIIGMTFFIGWISFVDHEKASETTANVGAAVIIIAFVVDLIRKITGLFRRA
jgi:hypothetical protein